MTVRQRRSFIVCAIVIVVWLITAMTGEIFNPRARAIVVADSLLITCSLAALLGVALSRWLIHDE